MGLSSRIQMAGVALIGASAVLALGTTSASALVVDFGVASIGGTISYTGANLQSATALNLDGTSLVVSRTSPADGTGLSPGDAISISPPVVSFPGGVLSIPITKSWTDSLGTFDETLTQVDTIDRAAPNALTMILSGTLSGPGIVGSQVAFLEYAATQVAGPGGAVSLSLTDASTSPAVPELSTWAMMGVGFAALGFATLRRGRKTDIVIA